MSEIHSKSGAELYRTALTRLLKDDGLGLSAQMAYHALFSVFPGLLVLTTVAQLFGLGAEDFVPNLVRLAERHLPLSTVELLQQNLPDLLPQASTRTITLGTLLLLWVASSFLNMVLKALSIAYRLPTTRHFFVRRMMALGLVIVFGLASAISFNLVVFGQPHITAFLTANFDLETRLAEWISVLRWTATPASLLLSAMLLYAIVPTRPLPLAMVWPGAATFTVLWILATGVFTAWVKQVEFGHFHGLIPHIIVTMMWFYLSCFLLLYGAEVNAVWFHMRHYDEQHPEIAVQ